MRRWRPRARVTEALFVAGAVAGAFAVMAAPRPARAQKSPLAQAATARAYADITAQRYGDAILELQAAVRYEPRFALGWYFLGSSYRHSGDCDRAVAAYRRYAELRPAQAEPHYGIGLCLETIGDRAGAVAEFRKYAEQAKSPAARSFVDSARQRAAAGSAATAKLTARQGEAADPPELADAAKLRGEQRVPDAVAAYRKWLAEHPKDESGAAARANAELGALLLVEKDWPAATLALREAVRIDPGDARSWYNLAFALRQGGNLADAVAAYFRYVTFKPKDPDPYYGLGLSLSALGRGDEALAALRTYVSLEKRPTEVHWVAKARTNIARLAAGGAGNRSGSAQGAAPTAASTPPAAPPADTRKMNPPSANARSSSHVLSTTAQPEPLPSDSSTAPSAPAPASPTAPAEHPPRPH